MYKGDGFSAKNLGKKLFHCQNDCSSDGPAGQFRLLESTLSVFTLTQNAWLVLIIIVINDYALLTNIQSRCLDIGQALFCEANTQLSSPNKLDWFAHLSSQLEHRICFTLPTHGFNHKIVINNYALLTRCEVKMAGYLRLYWPCLPLQGCALRKIEGSPALWTCEIQCAQQMISMKKQRFSSRLRTKVTDVGATGHRAQPGLGQ